MFSSSEMSSTPSLFNGLFALPGDFGLNTNEKFSEADSPNGESFLTAESLVEVTSNGDFVFNAPPNVNPPAFGCPSVAPKTGVDDTLLVVIAVNAPNENGVAAGTVVAGVVLATGTLAGTPNENLGVDDDVSELKRFFGSFFGTVSSLGDSHAKQ